MTISSIPTEASGIKWFAMCDLKRPNDPNRAYKVMENKGFEVFTPMQEHLIDKYGKHLRVDKPIFPDMLFVHTTRAKLDPLVDALPSLRYRLRIGHSYPSDEGVLIIDDSSMNNFRLACESNIPKEFLKPAEIDSSIIGRCVRIFCKSVPNGFEGNLLRVRGRGLKVVVRLSNMICMRLSLTKNDMVQLVDDKANRR